ncbi:macro domain-containing protein [Acutalibacter intestini]|uniref:macro domain-containing protein n=1 Tax=Acutalibacter intestini TaxID=3093659 RepID=UPI002AC99D89|nr:macro domain-containing protein [Acutalibacter sp. M00204]
MPPVFFAPIRTGEAVITPGFAPPAKYVIHAAGPADHPGNPERCRDLLHLGPIQSR